MTSKRVALAATTVLLGTAMVLTGCSAASAPDPTDMEAADSPLSRYLTALLGDGLTGAERSAQDRQVEELIAACMAEQGFDYVPVSHEDTFYTPDEWRPDDPEWVAQWGYGAVRFPGSEEMYAAEAEGDANTSYYESLSASEQAAYSTTLYGPELTDEQLAGSRDGSAPIGWDQQGCYGLGNHEVRGDDPLQTSEHTVLRQTIQDFQTTQFAAPDYAELNADWRDCMADAGYSGFDDPEAARNSIYDRMTEIFYAQTGPVSDMDDPALLALRDEEIDQALADLACRDETDFRARSWAIQVEQEDRFIADHRTEFDALEADIDQSG